MRVLGISAYYHDSAAALVADGEVVAAAQEERFTRKKHDSSFPKHAVNFCLDQSGLRPSEVDLIVFYDKPFLKFERLLETYLAFAPRGYRSFATALPVWIKEKLFQKSMLRKELKRDFPSFDFNTKLLFSEHHLSHAASAFFPSPFESAAILTMDGVGEWATTSLCVGKGNQIRTLREIHFPHSLGLLYSAFTYYTGFKVNSGEYKLMGLAPYGKPLYRDLILSRLLHLKPDGSFQLNLSYFDYCTGLRMTNRRFDELFEGKARRPDEPLTQKHMDIAASIQAVTEEAVLNLARFTARETGEKNLCLAGGVALNCVANGKIHREKIFDRIWIQPAAGDAGGAVGAALAAGHLVSNSPRGVSAGKLDGMKGSYLGPEYSQAAIEADLRALGAKFESFQDSEFFDRVSVALDQGKAVGWFQGRMEFGPRALGNRSILADPRPSTMQKRLNLSIKFRESFRPFAPSVLAEEVSRWFDYEGESPYMLMVAPLLERRRREMTAEENALFGIEKLNVPRSDIPAVTHVDYSARLQTVHRESNPRYYSLLEHFKRRTGCPVLVNTSFNVRGEPIVGTPQDAFRCFMGTGLDWLAIGNCVLEKQSQDPRLLKTYENQFEPD